MIIARSLWRRAILTAVAAAAFVSLCEVTILDSKYAAQTMLREMTAPLAPGARLAFSATAYCKGVTTTSGVATQAGIAASDPQLLPVGSVIEIDSPQMRYAGIYTIMDTGPSVQGRKIDIYMWNCNEALDFGRQLIHLVVLRLGWNPHATLRGLNPPPLPSRQLVPPPLS